MFKFSAQSIREQRQKENYDKAIRVILLNSSKQNLKKYQSNINIKQLDRLLEHTGLSYSTLRQKCEQDSLFASIVGFACAVSSTRQAKRDESYVIERISDSLQEQSTYFMEALDVHALVPTRDGRVLHRKEIKEENLMKSNDCLKSIDALIKNVENPNYKGYVFAKITTGEGGHQDNVSIEMMDFVKWCNEYSDADINVCLIDGTPLEKYKQYETDKIWIVNHEELQARLING